MCLYCNVSEIFAVCMLFDKKMFEAKDYDYEREHNPFN